jgi:23S rRNA (guanine2445-N2)-methyltransferase / 23S rRNA (guanine2069-N7)-methyltransferase
VSVTNGAFARRLEKNAQRLGAWARKNEITCFRIYDRDLPEVPVALDLYTDTDDVKWLHATVFEPRHGIDNARLQGWIATANASLSIAAAQTVTKRRAPGAQSDKLAHSGARIRVREAGCTMLVNLADYVDTGLFLDHRRARALVRAQSPGKRVLNLFAYTGAFSVQAAAGGAKQTQSVDLSPTYARWAEENLAINQFSRSEHFVVVMDAFEFLARDASRFDLVVIDPPTVSKSKRASSFEVQRDHSRLISAALDRLTPGGTIYFSTNCQGFVLDIGDDVKVDEITAQTVPADFPRRPPIHRAWRIRR